MHIQLTVAPWPALLSLEDACRYLSLDNRAFLALADRWRVEAVAVDGSQTMWRTRDLDALLRRLPTSKLTPVCEHGWQPAELSNASIDRIVHAISAYLGSNHLARPNKPLLVSIKEACTQLGISRTRVYEMIKNGSLSVRRIGRRTLVTQQSIEALFNHPSG